MKSFNALSFILLLALATAAGRAAETADPFTPPHFPLPAFTTNTYNVLDFGATASGLTNDGGVIDGVNYRDITIKSAASPIYILLTARLRSGDPAVKVGSIKNVKISNITITDCHGGRQGPVQPATISGRPDGQIENIVLENVIISYPGGGTNNGTDIVPPYPKDYSPRSLGPRPASGFYIRHVKGLTFKNIEFTFDAEDQRPPLVATDVDGFVLDNFKTQKPAAIPTMRLEQIKDFTIKNCPALPHQTSATIAKASE